MGGVYVLHIAAGSLALLSGFTALYAAKGATVHRRGGMVFVVTMLTMTSAGFLLAAVRGAAPAVNIPAALLTSYLVVTSLATVRPPASRYWFDRGSLAVALSVALVSLYFGVETVVTGVKRQGIPAFPYFMFGVVGLLAAAGDLRVLRSGPLSGAPRLSRHLWRMCFALFIAAMSFFIGQARVIPEPLRIAPLLALPVLAVPVTMFWWLWRVRSRRSAPVMSTPAGHRQARATGPQGVAGRGV